VTVITILFIIRLSDLSEGMPFQREVQTFFGKPFVCHEDFSLGEKYSAKRVRIIRPKGYAKDTDKSSRSRPAGSSYRSRSSSGRWP
jgi:hypothetical protein